MSIIEKMTKIVNDGDVAAGEEIIQIIVGKILVKPSVVFKKPLAVIPRITDSTKKM